MARQYNYFWLSGQTHELQQSYLLRGNVSVVSVKS